MKFILTYDGELPSRGSKHEQWEIRKQFHPQLEELWRVDPVLQRVDAYRQVPTTGYWFMDVHHSGETVGQITPNPNSIDVLQPIERGGRRFRPLIRESLLLNCGLKIIFLRKEEPGRVYQGGDLDNRLKTLFDALSIPNKDQVIPDPTLGEPTNTLLEDDGLITRLDVDTRRLLTRPGASEHEVRLIIEVTVGVTQARLYNQAFLGD